MRRMSLAEQHRLYTLEVTLEVTHEVTSHTCRYSAASEQPPHRPQRNSYSGHGGGPISGEYYYRGQEAGGPGGYYAASTQVSEASLAYITHVD